MPLVANRASADQATFDVCGSCPGANYWVFVDPPTPTDKGAADEAGCATDCASDADCYAFKIIDDKCMFYGDGMKGKTNRVACTNEDWQHGDYHGAEHSMVGAHIGGVKSTAGCINQQAKGCCGPGTTNGFCYRMEHHER